MSAQISDSHVTSSEDHSTSDKQANYRLVIRAKVLTEPIPDPVQPRAEWRWGAIAAALAIVIALIWGVIALLRSDSPPTTANQTETSAAAESTAAATVPVTTPPASVSATDVEPRTTHAPTSAATPAIRAPDAPPTPVNEVIPDAPRSALNTIRGTVRVAIRVTIDQHGAVNAATTHRRGPSRYFERLSLEAARQWTFTPATSDAPRSMLLRFFYTQDGVRAEAEPAS